MARVFMVSMGYKTASVSSPANAPATRAVRGDVAAGGVGAAPLAGASFDRASASSATAGEAEAEVVAEAWEATAKVVAAGMVVAPVRVVVAAGRASEEAPVAMEVEAAAADSANSVAAARMEVEAAGMEVVILAKVLAAVAECRAEGWAREELGAAAEVGRAWARVEPLAAGAHTEDVEKVVEEEVVVGREVAVVTGPSTKSIRCRGSACSADS